MCGRFNIISHPLARLLLEISGQQFALEDRYNIAPTEPVPVLLRTGASGEWDLREMRWWLVPRWAKEPTTKYSMFNAKSEGLLKSSAFRAPFAEHRCVIPASGYYEWQKTGGGKVPWYITPRDADGFAFAALWEHWEHEGDAIDSCTMITTRVHPGLAFVHDRMPVHLTPEQIRRWVDPAAEAPELLDLLAPRLNTPVQAQPVSTWVSNARNKGPRCVEAAGEAVRIDA